MTNEEKLDLFADLLDPVTEILGDKEIADTLRASTPAKAIRVAIKNHKSAVITMLALIDGEPIDTYTVPRPVALAKKLLSIVNDPEMQELFTGQQQKNDAAASGAATENTEGGAH